MEPIAQNLLAFCRGLRNLGFAVGESEVSRCLEALTHIDVGNLPALHDALSAVLVKSPEQVFWFHEAFRQFFLLLNGTTDPRMAQTTWLANVAESRRRTRAPQVIWQGRSPDDEPEMTVTPVRSGANRQEVLRQKDFAALTADEQEEVARSLTRLRPLIKVTRRQKPRGRKHAWDLERTLRRGTVMGELVRPYFRGPGQKWRRCVFLVDVSGSMDPYSRMTLLFVHSLMQNHWPLEAFVFSTRLTRVTPLLDRARFHQALSDIAALTPDFSGGTRIDHALDHLCRHWRVPILAHQPWVVLVSDGLDTGDTTHLDTVLRRLKRLTRRIIWWNPGMGDPGFAVSARTTQMLYHHADQMSPAYNWKCLEDSWIALAAQSR